MSRKLHYLLKPYFFLALFFLDCNGHCDPSSCGNLRNISYPFWLKGDPTGCGHPDYELSCENNRTILYLYSGKYYVDSISYANFTIQILDPGLLSDNCSPLPHYSLTTQNFSQSYYNYDSYDYSYDYSNEPYQLPGMFLYAQLVFVSCPFQVESQQYVNFTPCINSTNSSAMYSYAVSGDMKPSDLKDSCRIDLAVAVSSDIFHYNTRRKGIFRNNMTFYKLHQRLLMGVELEWARVNCRDCFTRRGGCYRSDRNMVECYADSCAGVTIPYKKGKLQRFCSSFAFSVATIHYGSSVALFISFVLLGDGTELRNHYHRSFIEFMSETISVVWSDLEKPLEFILGGRTICGILCVLVFLVYKFRRRHMSLDEGIEDFLQGHFDLGSIRYSYSDVKKMTKGFKEKLGHGGFGSVFKGKLRSGRLVAVKMLEKSKSNGQDFMSEVATIGRIHHANVVQLSGFCAEGSKRALIYDFMPNGSLEKYIFPQEEKIMHLSWEKMYEIAVGVARGIEYLHRGCEIQILHFDIKPHNILLDENFNAKISDFGLAKLYQTDDSIVSLTAVRGTIGYIAPELFYKNIGGVSYKADVYSFGMLLMEMAGRRKNLNLLAESSSQVYFPLWVYEQLNCGKEMEIGDATEEERKIAKKLAVVALWCIQLKPTNRPSMNKVVEMLEGALEILQMPPKPSLVPEDRTVASPA
ncbi:hypothetical protein GIB67_042252 [Kingdonia uniflora]|uniref:Protein kinase domain-containing protein n=1 Tax=Kingdonia uniflora TaxID=39325 RepID=A0A7J7LE55_9MAGN|nr:hypothetical protein GIB67_042252 [Kingdonia uniflora]